MYSAPVILKSIHRQSFNNTQPRKWEEVMCEWANKNHKESVYKILEYLGVNYNTNASILQIPHGSIQIELELKEDRLIIQAPFLLVNNSLKLPLFRQVLQINQEPLHLTRIHLKDETLQFYFESPYPLCEPNKILEVLKEICIHADLYDDAFIRKYRAERFSEPEIIPLESEIQSKCVESLRKIISETELTIQYLIKERKNEFLWDSYILLFLKIDFIIAPNGHLKSDLEKWIVEMHSPLELSEKINIANKAIQSLKKLSDDQIIEDLYQINTFVPLKELISKKNFKNQLIQIQAQIQKEFQKREYLAAYFTTQYQLLLLTYQYDLDDDCMNALLNILENTTGIINETKTQRILFVVQKEIEQLFSALKEIKL